MNCWIQCTLLLLQLLTLWNVSRCQVQDNPWDVYSKKPNAIIFWQEYPRAREGRREDYACDTPLEYDNYLTNCISTSHFFPASEAICDHCGTSVRIQCWSDKKWYPVGTNITRSCSLTLHDNVLCVNPPFHIYNCPHQTSIFVPAGTRRVCTCLSNCRPVLVECNENRQWQFRRGGECHKTSDLLNKGYLDISYSGGWYNFSCKAESSYHLTGGTSRVECRDGKLLGRKPTCQLDTTGETQQCTKPPLPSYLRCPSSLELSAKVGATSQCKCTSTCRKVTMVCLNTGEWHFESSGLCEVSSYSYTERNMKVSYTTSSLDANPPQHNVTYTFDCKDREYELVGARSLVCVNGELEGEQPTCQQKASTDTTSSSTSPLSTSHPTETSTVISNNQEQGRSNQDDKGEGSNIIIILISVVLVLILIVLLLVVFIWYRRRQKLAVSTSGASVVQNPAFQMAALPNDEDPDYDYPELNFRPCNKPEEPPMYHYPELNIRPDDEGPPELPPNRPEEAPMYDYPELNVRSDIDGPELPPNRPQQPPLYDYPELNIRPDNGNHEYEYPVLNHRPENNAPEDQEYVANDMYVPARY